MVGQFQFRGHKRPNPNIRTKKNLSLILSILHLSTTYWIGIEFYLVWDYVLIYSNIPFAWFFRCLWTYYNTRWDVFLRWATEFMSDKLKESWFHIDAVTSIHSVEISEYFCHSDFTSIWEKLEVLKLQFLQFLGLNFVILVNFSLQKVQNW